MTRPIILLAFLLVLFVDPLSAQSANPSFDYRDSIQTWLHEFNTPAVGVAIIEGYQLKDAEVFGTLDGTRKAPLNTVFNVASLTKPVTALVTLKLVAEGKWSLDDSLSPYWIDPDVKKDPRHNELTSRIVLSHQTGFPNWRWENGYTTLHFDFEPGTHFQYSGEGYEYLRHALENKFHQSLSALARSYLFDKAGMDNTRFTWDPSLEPRFALWYDRFGINKYPIKKTTEPCAADDLLTTIQDYGAFAAYVLTGGGLPDTLFAEMVKPQVQVKPHVSYGLGWEIVNDLPNNEYALVHTGADVGVRAAVILLPVSGRGVVILTNGDQGMEIVKRVTRATLDVGAEIIEDLK